MNNKLGAQDAPVNKKSSPDELRAFFREVLPEFDENRVYPSDILKLCQWYAILNSQTELHELLKEEQDEAGAEEEE
jgi:hypothetical protein